MNKVFEKFAKEISYTPKGEFLEANLLGAMLDPKTQVFNMRFRLNSNPDIDLMAEFLLSINKNFKHKSQFAFEIVTPIYDEKISSYVEWILRNYLKKPTIANSFQHFDRKISGHNYNVIVTDPYANSQLRIVKKDIERIVKKLGWDEFTIEITFDSSQNTLADNRKKAYMNSADKLLDNHNSRTDEKKEDNSSKVFTKSGLVDIPISEIAESGLSKISTKGIIFSKEVFKTKSDWTIITFNITDDKDSIYVKAFAKAQKDIDKYSLFNTGDTVMVNGTYQVDAYTNEPTINSSSINKIDSLVPERNDNQQNKFIDFSVKTKMSVMDGMIDAKKLFKAVEKFKQPAVGITDVDSIQSYPDVYNSFKGSGIKPIFGVSLNTTDKNSMIVYNPKDAELNSEKYIVFDLETTGLSAEHEEIIEFGCVIVQGGDIVGKHQFFVKPKKPIPKFITDITNISEKDVENGLGIKEALEKIIEIFGNHTIVAHNANFDFHFLDSHLVKNGFEKLKNTVVDTLTLSRYIHPNKKSYALKAVSKRLGIGYDVDVAHRADYDANVLAEVWMRFISELEEDNILTIPSLYELTDESIYKKAFSTEIKVIAKNQKGLKELFRLLSKSNIERYFGSNKLFLEDIKNREDILIGSGALKTKLFELMTNGYHDQIDEYLEFLDYVEITPLKNYIHLIENNGYSEKGIIETINYTIKKAKEMGKIVIGISDARYVDPSDKFAHEILINSSGLGGARHFLASRSDNPVFPTLNFLTTDEALEEFEFLGNAALAYELVITNTNKLSESIDEEIIVIKDKLYTPKMDQSDKKLTDLVYKNAREQYGDDLPKYIEDRIKVELTPITKYGFDIIYWISHVLVKKSLDDGYVVGSRGSVGSSVVATFAKISEVNPLAPHYYCKKCKFSEFFLDSELNSGFDLDDKDCPQCNIPLEKDGQKIPFETFLGFDADKVPDIDLNFSGEYQSTIHAEVRNIFGSTHSFRAGTISTIAERTAFGYVKIYLERRGILKSKAYIEYISSKLVGTKRTTGQHPGGIIVIPSDLDVEDFTPINFPANDVKADWKTTHFDFHAIHDNVLKLDLLGHDDPTAIRMLQSITGISPDDIPFYDKKVLSIFSSTKALGVEPDDINGEKNGALGIPEFGTQFVRRMLDKANVESFGDLIAISGLSHGTDVWSGNAEELIKKGKKLSEVVSCRDNIMTDLLIKKVPNLTAFKIMEKVRKGKGVTNEEVALLKKYGVEDWYIDTLQKIKYMFPKAHATAYVMMAWRIAWFKVYYPLAYYATFFTTRSDHNDIQTILAGKRSVSERLKELDARRFVRGANALKTKDFGVITALELANEAMARDVKFKNIDINKSAVANWTLEKETNSLIPPFSVIDGLGLAVAKTVVNARDERPFSSVDDILSRTSLNRTHVKKFKEMGIFDNFETSNQIKLNM